MRRLLPSVTAGAAAALAASVGIGVLAGPAAGADFLLRIDAGSTTSYSDSSGRSWSADRYFSGGATSTATATPELTSDAKLYQTARTGRSFSYAIPVAAAGVYTVRLHLAELQSSVAGSRVLAAAAEGRSLASNVDLVKAPGYRHPLVLEVPVRVNDGTLNLGLTASTGEAILSGLEVLGQGLGAAPPPTPTPSATTPLTLAGTVNDRTIGTGLQQFAYAGASWTACGGCQPTNTYQSGHTYGYAIGDRVTFRFSGAQVKLYGVKEPTGGIATVSVDGGSPVNVDTYAVAKAPAILYTSSVLATGEHTVTVTVSGRRNGAATGNAVSVDKAEVYASGSSSPPTATPTSTTSPTQTATPTPTPTSATPGLISRQGQRLFRNGTEYKVAGMNADTWFGCWTGERERTTDANLDRYFRELNPHSMTRIFAGAGFWDPVLMDRIVAAARRHSQYLMVVLSDANADGTQCGSNKGAGYDQAATDRVRSHIRAVVPRYAGEPTIGIWEVINEGSRDAGAQSFYRQTTDLVNSLDPDTLIMGGAGTCYTTNWQSCVAVDNVPNNDFVNFHEYDWNNGGVSHWADETHAIADQLGLPWLVGETGFCCGGGDSGSQQGNADRLRQEYQAYLNAQDSAGMLYWDFKWAYPENSTANLGSPLWTAASTFRHAFQR